VSGRRWAAVPAAFAIAALGMVPARAEPAHSRPQGPAALRFAPDFPVLTDHEWGFRLGGFGGIRAGALLGHVPVIFVHGNNVDAADWYPVRDDFRAAGWSDQELWALSYNGLGSAAGTAVETQNPERDQEHTQMQSDGTTHITNDDVNVPDLYDFILAELSARIPQAATLLRSIVIYLKGQRDNVLAFAAQLDRDFAALANEFGIPADLIRELFAVQTLDLDNPRRWRRDAPLRRILGTRYFPLSQALDEVQRRTVRSSSLVENLNSRLRSYFFLRRHLGNNYLSLLQFFLNHRRYPRSECPERVDKSPAELLNSRTHPHWLELLGYTRFSRN